MILKMFDRFPGGRVLVILTPIILFLVGSLTLGPSALVQVDNVVVLVVSVACLVPWRRSLAIFFREQHDAGAVWFSLGMFGIFLTTVFFTVYGQYLRVYGRVADDYIVAAFRFSYALEFGALFLAPQARDGIVPPRGWLVLLLLVTLASCTALLGMWLF